MKAYKKESRSGIDRIAISDIKPTQFQIYLDKIYNFEKQEGLLGLIDIIKNNNLIVPLFKEDPQEIVNRRENEYFSDLVRLAVLKGDSSIYAIAGTHRLVAISIANLLYKTRNYLEAKEYDLAIICT